jgi:methyltransferase FkbM-like protein
MTLENLTSQVPAASIDLMTMDIEGAELDVLECVPTRVLERVRQFSVEFHQFIYPESRNRIEPLKSNSASSVSGLLISPGLTTMSCSFTQMQGPGLTCVLRFSVRNIILG